MAIVRYVWKYATLNSEPFSLSYIDGTGDTTVDGNEQGLASADVVDLINTAQTTTNYRMETVQNMASVIPQLFKTALQHDGVIWKSCDIFIANFGSTDPDELSYLYTVKGINYGAGHSSPAQTFETYLRAGVFAQVNKSRATRQFTVGCLSQFVLQNYGEYNAIEASQLTSTRIQDRYLYNLYRVLRENTPLAISGSQEVNNTYQALKVRNEFRTSSRKR